MVRFNFTITHIPGKELVTANAPSRAPVLNPTKEDQCKNQEMQAMLMLCTTAYQPQKNAFRRSRSSKERTRYVSNSLHVVSIAGRVKMTYLDHYPFAYELTVVNDLLMRGSRIVVPMGMHLEMLDKLHKVHLGITKC